MNSIDIQPQNQVSNLGLLTSFECVGSAGATYQWQIRKYGGSFVDANAPFQYAQSTFDLQLWPSTNSIYTIAPFSYDLYYRCEVTFPDNEVLYSNEVEITAGEPANVGTYNGWEYSERYGGLTVAQRWHNADRLMILFRSWGWSVEFCSAVIGNMWAESGMSPGTWENWPAHLTENTGRGLGFVQWTAAINTLIPFCFNTYPNTQWRNNGTYQADRIYWEWQNNTEFSGYGGWAGNIHSTKPPGELCERFVWGYLRPTQQEGQATMTNRMRYSLMVYEKYYNNPLMAILIPIMKKMTIEGRKNR